MYYNEFSQHCRGVPCGHPNLAYLQIFYPYKLTFRPKGNHKGYPYKSLIFSNTLTIAKVLSSQYFNSASRIAVFSASSMELI